MELNRFSERLTIFVTIFVGIVAAIGVGKMLAQGNTTPIATAGVGAALIFSTLYFRERVWVVIPSMWALYGQIHILPLPFAVKDLAVIFALAATIICIALKVVRQKPTFTLLDGLFWLNITLVAVAFIRNPVGTEATQSIKVGGRPYLDAAVAVTAFWVLNRSFASAKTMRRIPLYATGMVGFVFIVNVVVFFSPALEAVVLPIYSGLHMVGMDTPSEVEEGGRYMFFQDIGKFCILLLCSRFAPITLINPLRFPRFIALVLVTFALLLSGFRSALVVAGAYLLLGTYFRNGWGTTLRLGLMGSLFAGLLMMGHGTFFNLPLSAQRALAFVPDSMIPSSFDQNAIESGTSSTRWRTEMWREALTTDRYISDKVMGDGFGMTRNQMIEAQRARAASVYTNQDSQETMAVTGAFHNGPVATIRVVGYIGLLIALITLLLLATSAVKLIRQTRDTPFFEPTLFFCIPIVFEPFLFCFIFGAYTSFIPFLGISLGMMKVLSYSLERWRRTNEGREPVPDVPEARLDPTPRQLAAVAE